MRACTATRTRQDTRRPANERAAGFCLNGWTEARMKRKRLQIQRTTQPGTAVGVAWYRSAQWDLLRRISSDKAAMEDTYEEWLADARASILELKRIGIDAQPVDVDVNELLAWCQKN